MNSTKQFKFLSEPELQTVMERAKELHAGIELQAKMADARTLWQVAKENEKIQELERTHIFPVRHYPLTLFSLPEDQRLKEAGFEPKITPEGHTAWRWRVVE